MRSTPWTINPTLFIPLGRSVAAGKVERGVTLPCGSGVGASIAANKISGVRAGLTHDVLSAHQPPDSRRRAASALVKGSALDEGQGVAYLTPLDRHRREAGRGGADVSGDQHHLRNVFHIC